MKNGLRDGEAFDRLVEEHYDDVLAYCRRHAPSYDDAPDVAQEAFLRFVRDGSPDADPAMAIGGGEVGALVDALSPELRDVVELRFDQGFKVGEIADVLGVSRFAVNRRLNRALAELRRGLEGKDEA